MLALSLCSCSSPSGSSSPKGVIERSNGNWYVINTTISSFQLTGTTGQVHLSYFSAQGGGLSENGNGRPEMAYFRKVVDGGWVVYIPGKSGCMYISSDISSQAVGTACMTFALNDADNIMSYNEAKKYISFLK